jgi:hypothetical protein
MPRVRLLAELEEVSKLRERLYWEFTRSKNAPPVPVDVTRRFYEIIQKLRRLKFKSKFNEGN